MSLRVTLLAALGAALVLPALANAGPHGKRGESASKEAPFTRLVYPVAELVVPIDYGDGKYCDQTQQDRLLLKRLLFILGPLDKRGHGGVRPAPAAHLPEDG